MMPAFLVPLHEYNTCHEPGGQPTGGRFCGKDAFVPRPPKPPLPFTRRPTIHDNYSSRMFMTPRERHGWEVLKQEAMEARLAMTSAEEAALRAGDPFGLLKPDVIKHLNRPDLVELRHRHENLVTRMRDFGDDVTRRGILQVARELDFPPGNIRIINDANPREFTVGGMQWKEGGHYSPQTNMIEINLATARGIGIVRMVAHEIAHAKFEVWRAAMDRESEALRDWQPSGLAELTTPNRTPWSASGEVRPQFRAEFRRKFPAHAAVADTWGSAYTASSLSRQMMEDDGFTDYSKAYWAEANNPAKQQHYMYTSHTGRQLMGSTLYRAVDETLAEVSAWRVARRMQPVVPSVPSGMRQIRTTKAPRVRKGGPSEAWRKFSASINQFYRAHGRPS
jgi:hypothetical protein